MAIDVNTFAARDAAARATADGLAACLEEGLAARGRASLALSGGRTPNSVLPLLAAAGLDWSRVTLTLIDERWVAPDHADSNQGLVERLFRDGPAAAAPMVGLKTAAAEPAAGVAEVERRLAGLSWPLDAAFLGMGEDGHVASLFPGDASWALAPGRCVPVPARDGRQARMSLAPDALLDMRRLLLLIFGAEKRRVFDRARRPGPAVELPIRVVLHQDRVPVTVFLAD